MKGFLIRWLFGSILVRITAVEDENIILARYCKEQRAAISSMASEINELRNELRNSKPSQPEAPLKQIRKATTWREFAAAAVIQQQQQGVRS